METKGERLNYFIRSLNINNKEFAEIMGVAPNYISMLIKNRVSISNKFLYNLTKVYQDFNTEWLETGKEPMNLPKTKTTDSPTPGSIIQYGEFYTLADQLQNDFPEHQETIKKLKELYGKVLLEKDLYQKKYVDNLEKLSELQEEVYKVMSVSKKR